MTGEFEGKLVLVTGGTRGIGAATSLALAGEGAHVFATFRDPKKEGRVRQFVDQAQGLSGLIIPVLSGITRPTGREQLIDAILLTTGTQAVDVLVSNAAGGIDKQNPWVINSTAKIALIRELALLLPPRSLVVEMESAWSRFYPHVEQLPMYDPVAESKKRGRERLLREIPQIAEAAGREIGLAFVCGHAVADTITVKLLQRKADKDKWAQLIASAEGGKLPTTEDMAQAVLRVIHKFYNRDLEFGHTEYVGIPNWNQEKVKRHFYMYGPSALLVDQTVFHSPTQSFTSTRVGPRHFEPLFGSNTEPLNYRRHRNLAHFPLLLADFMAMDDHARDHFTEQTGLKIVPGYKLVTAAALSYTHDLQSWFGEPYRWTGILGETRFLRPLSPGMSVGIYHLNEAPTPNFGFPSDFELKAGETVVATISGLLMESGVDRNRHLKGRLIEIAAQAAGAQYLHSLELAGDNPADMIPLFRSIGPIQFMGVVRPGETIETESHLTEVRPNGFKADTVLRVDDRTIAKINGINCKVLRGGLRALRAIERILRPR